MGLIKISQLPSGSIPTDSDFLPIVDFETLTTTALKVAYLAAYVSSSIQQLSLNSLTASAFISGTNANITRQLTISGNLNIGTNNPDILFGAGSAKRVTLFSVDPIMTGLNIIGVESAEPFIQLAKGRGTALAITPPQGGDTLGSIYFAGSIGSNQGTARNKLTAVATENWAPGSVGNRTELYTTPNGSSTQVLRMVIGQNGNIGIGPDVNPSDLLTLNASSSANGVVTVQGTANLASFIAQNGTATSAQLLAFGTTAGGTMLGLNRTGLTGLSLSPDTTVGAAIIRVGNATPLVVGVNDAESFRVRNDNTVAFSRNVFTTGSFTANVANILTSLTASILSGGNGNTLRIDAGIFGYSSVYNNLTGNYVLTNADNGKVISINASSQATVTLPLNLTGGFGVSLFQVGVGALFVTGVVGVTTFNRQNQFRTAGQYAVASVIAVSGNAYIFAGDTQL